MRFPIPFSKMSGAGNDFIVVDHREPFLAEELQPGFARAVCRRNLSVGGDGLILIEEDDEGADFRWRFYNADGSAAEMCGNGARCAARFAFLHGIAPAAMRFRTLAGIIQARVVDTAVQVGLTPPTDQRLDLEVELAGGVLRLDCINTGVPHAVVFPEGAGEVDVAGLGRAIRFHPEFAPAGTNVNFVWREDGGRLRVRTYERGVEAETLACGTGATAAAIIGARRGLVTPPVTVITSGGERLVIHFRLAGEEVEDLFLEGPAHLVYHGQLQAEALHGCDLV